MLRIVLFDVDGTLLLSGGAGLKALRRVFRERFGVPNAVNGIEFHGRTDPQILDSIAASYLARPLLAGECNELVDAYLVALDEFLADTGFQVLDGVQELLEELEGRQDVLLGLATGNVERGAWAKLRRGDLDGFFAFGGFGSDDADRDELTRLAVRRGRDRAGAAGPDAEVVVVGDTIHDVRSAAAAGADCLAVATGNASVEQLEAAGARWTVPTLADPAVREILASARPD